jgi:Sulfotransferase family
MAAAPREPKPKVLYVLGAHRSGSTVLGVTLGNCDGVFFGGELHSWFSRHGVPSFGGEEGKRLWGEVSEAMSGAEELFGHDTQLYIDRSSALFRVHRWPARRRLLARYRRLTEELYRAIARASNSNYIVDTSHYPPRAAELARMAGIELYVLFLVRDPQAIIASFDPRDEASGSKGLLNANLYLWVTYFLSLLVFLRHPRERRMLVRHEDFLADPRAVVRQILDLAGCAAEVPDLTALRTGCPLQGNRFLKASQVISLRGPGAPRAQISRLTAAMQFFWKPIFKRLRPASAASAGVAVAAGDGGV